MIIIIIIDLKGRKFKAYFGDFGLTAWLGLLPFRESFELP